MNCSFGSDVGHGCAVARDREGDQVLPPATPSKLDRAARPTLATARETVSEGDGSHTPFSKSRNSNFSPFEFQTKKKGGPES